MNMDSKSPRDDCGPDCACFGTNDASRWGRRDFLKLLGAGAGALAVGPLKLMAGPFTRADYEKLVPADKKLRPEWVKSLTDRGERTVYRGNELEKIGMPIGGICAGQLYLGGDGRLWHWDIFNQRTSTGPDHYAQPMTPASPLSQGFAVRYTGGGTTREVALDRSHWRELTFIGEYPIGYVDYRDPDLPLEVRLEAFAPFIPLNTEDSSLPATVMNFTLTNRGQAELEVELVGWLENAVCLHSAKVRAGFRRNRLVRQAGLLCLDCSAEGVPAGVPADRPDMIVLPAKLIEPGLRLLTGHRPQA